MTCTISAPLRLADLTVGRHACSLRIHITGELDLISGHTLTVALTQAARDLYVTVPRPVGGTVQLDLSELTFLDTSGITALVNSRSILSGLGFGLCLLAPQGEVLRLLECALIGGWLPDDVECPECEEWPRVLRPIRRQASSASPTTVNPELRSNA